MPVAPPVAWVTESGVLMQPAGDAGDGGLTVLDVMTVIVPVALTLTQLPVGVGKSTR
jgi:hypothetical protein